jgi:Ca2+-binding RTX toxin-like protein
LLLVDLVSADDDTIDSGDGRDVVFGQRGNDVLADGEGDDLLFGDNATNVVPFETNIPQIVHGDRLIDVAAGVPIVLEAGGSVVVPDVALETGGFNLADPMLTIVPDVVPALFESARNDSLQRADGSSLVPYVVTVPDAVHHADALAGNDPIDGQGGDDLIFGDDASFRSPLTSRYNGIRKAIDDVTNELDEVQHSLVHLSQDYDLAEHTVLGADYAHDVFVGNDVIDGGAGDDMIVNDTEKKGKKEKKDSGHISDDDLELTLANPWLDSFLRR